MDAQSLARLAALYDEAADLTVPQREAWLASLQGEDSALGEQLRRLLEHEASSETADLLDRGPAFPTPDEPVAESFVPGQRVGPYRLVARLGEGGMGEVWLADRADAQLQRRVALKLPLLGARRSVLVQRFARERDILAALEHPHIARLYDAGFADDGQPYLALEHVQGVAIDVWCRTRNPGVSERLRLLLQVTEAVAFAHRRLVLHRDLKPANILVTEEGQVRLLDFGIAKLLENESDAAGATELTQLGGRALTPRYASPEQMRGEPLTTASDVYSLGVVAYEVLTGASPYGDERRSAAAMEQAIEQGLVRPASSACDDARRREALRGDIDAILQHALRADPAQRYSTVDALAEDWRRHLQGERVYARPDSAAYRVQRWVQRHRMPLLWGTAALLGVGVAIGIGATALVMLALAAGLAAALWQARRAREQARIARTEARTAQAVQGFVLGIFNASSADQADPLKARQRSAIDLLHEGARRIEHELDDAPAAKLQVLQTLANMCDDMAEDSEANRLREVGVRSAERAFGPRSPELARALADTAISHGNKGRSHLALAALERAEAVVSALRHPDPDLREALDIAWGDHYRFTRDARGLPFAQRAAASALKRPPSNNWLNSLALLGVMQRLAGDLELSAQTFDRAVRLAPQIPGGALSVLAAVHQEAASTAQQRGDAERGERHVRAMIEIDTRASGPDSDHVIFGLRTLAALLAGHGRIDEARALFADAHARLAGLALTTGAAHVDGVRRALCMHEARSLLEAGDPAQALARVDVALALTTEPGANPRTAALVHHGRAEALFALQRLEEAGAEVEATRELCERFALDGPDWKLRLAALESAWKLARADAPGALAHASRALHEFGDAARAADPDAVAGLQLLACAAALDAGERTAAVPLARQALDTVERPPCALRPAPLRQRANALLQRAGG